MTPKRILLVEDELLIAQDERLLLENLGYVVNGIANSGEEALRKIEEDRPDLVLMDIILKGGMDGIEVAEKIRGQYDLPVVFVTAYADEQFIARAKLTEPFGYVVKPFDQKSLASNVEVALYKHSVDQRLRVSEEKFRSLIEFTNVAHWKVEVATERFLYISPQIEALLGYPATTWTDINSWVERIHPDDRERAVQYCHEKTAAGEDHNFEYRAITADERTVWIRDTVSVVMDEQGPRELVGFMADITQSKEYALEKERLQRELQQARKMEALGQLTGGIAHDFNNILDIILDNTELALSYCVREGQDKLVGHLKYIGKAGERARHLVAKMLAYSHHQVGDEKLLWLQPRIKENIKLLRSILPVSIEINTEIDEYTPAVMIDVVQFNQLLIYLCVNARDAMDGKGNFTIRLGWTRELGTECAACHKKIEGDWVELSVTDIGSGISPEALDCIFDPFFTTKDMGKRTGMGLSVINSIMHNHGGHILVETELGQGTSFRLLFPLVVGETKEAPVADQSSVGLPHD